MRLLQTASVAVAALSLGGCFQSSTILRVKADRSGTIEQRTVFTGAALAQLKQFAQLGGPSGRTTDLLSEDQARAMAASIGPGVTYVSSTPIKTETTEGRDSTYAFQDINTLKINQQPPVPGGVSVRADSLGVANMQDITFQLEMQPGGNALLRISMPEMKNLPGMPPAQTTDNPTAAQMPNEQQIAKLKQVAAGMRLTVAVEPDGRVVKTNCPFVEGNRVTLLDLDFDKIIANDEAMRKLQGAKTPAELQAVMKEIPGVNFTTEREITIEFAPKM